MNHEISFEDARLYIKQLDLRYIVETMCSQHYPLPRWDKANAERCLNLYKNFLLLQKKHLPYALVPTREIDEFWHNHILYTKNYLHDSLNIFGYYLHHDPASPNEDNQQLIDAYLKTKQYYFSEFGVSLDLIIK